MSKIYKLKNYSFSKKFKNFVEKSYIKQFDRNVFNMKKRLEYFHNAYSGSRCFIMGNGPSLNKMELKLLENEFVWGTNRCYLLFDRITWRPKFYIAVDKRVVPDNAEEINNLSCELSDTLFFFPLIFRQQLILNSNNNVFWYNEINNHVNNLPYSMFSLDPSEYVYSVCTVTVAALQLAVYLGFNPIFMIGCDTSYTVPNTVHYENGDPNLLISTTADPNHFDPNYFGIGKKWHEPNVNNMIFHYEQARKFCDDQNVQIINATIGGNLEVIPRVNYLELFN